MLGRPKLCRCRSFGTCDILGKYLGVQRAITDPAVWTHHYPVRVLPDAGNRGGALEASRNPPWRIEVAAHTDWLANRWDWLSRRCSRRRGPWLSGCLTWRAFLPQPLKLFCRLHNLLELCRRCFWLCASGPKQLIQRVLNRWLRRGKCLRGTRTALQLAFCGCRVSLRKLLGRCGRDFLSFHDRRIQLAHQIIQPAHPLSVRGGKLAKRIRLHRGQFRSPAHTTGCRARRCGTIPFRELFGRRRGRFFLRCFCARCRRIA